ncbi:uncharacterized protein [Rutidosis leptorrhynchoides]|uniref:uncharacterized protein n=1 Tax=Rutidosis leptorrhynchoides TaxID=125765 RepID=UPI003A98D366
MKAPMYLLDKGVLYRKSFLGPHLQCLNPTQAESIIREVHEGMCALHSGHKTVASKIMRLGYYWPSMYRDAAEVIRKCQSCQLHAPVSKAPRHPMIPVASPWPFCKWAINIVGPFPAGPGGVKFLQTFTSVAHPQANGQCEVTNRDIVLGIKARLGLCQRGWIDEMSNILWAHCTTPKGATNETPFSLVYGSEAVIPAEINVPTMRIASFDESSNSEELRENLNLV